MIFSSEFDAINVKATEEILEIAKEIDAISKIEIKLMYCKAISAWLDGQMANLEMVIKKNEKEGKNGK